MGKNILIVDDSLTTRKLLSYMVKSVGHNPVQAINGLDALEKLALNDIALVLTDMNMPHMDGLEMVKVIRQDNDKKDVPIIMISTEVYKGKEKPGGEGGVDIFMKKPVTTKWLAYQLEKLL